MLNTSPYSFELSWPCSEIKERIKKTKDEKKAKKAEVTKSQKGQTKGAVQKGSKGPKLGGGGGKRWKNWSVIPLPCSCSLAYPVAPKPLL